MATQRRDWWRPWNWSTRRWVVVLIVGLITSPILTRWYCLWQVPDVALPFDFDEFVADETGDPVDHAFLHYAAAVATVRSTGSRWSSQGLPAAAVATEIDTFWQDPDREVSSLLQRWLRDNAAALEEFRIGGASARARGPSFRTIDTNTLLNIHGDLRNLARLARLEGLRCERAGDTEAAWKWHLANLQCARHAETPKIAVCRLVAYAVRRLASEGILHWAESPEVTAAQLRAARAEVLREAALRTPRLECSKGEYVISRNTLRLVDAPNYLLPNWSRGVFGHAAWLPLKRAGLWVTGQPERLMRLQRQLLVNNLKHINRPLFERPQTIDCKTAVVFQDDFDQPGIRGQMPPDRLAELLDRSHVRLEGYLPSISSPHFDRAIQREEACLSSLVVALACHEFRHHHGTFPASLQELVPGYLQAVPFDPMSTKPVPMNYRRESDSVAAIWSVGDDGADDGGDITARGRPEKDTGYRIRAGNTASKPAKTGNNVESP